MPDFKTCVKDDEGNVWCWDRETQSVVQFVLKRPAIAKIPSKVLVELVKAIDTGREQEEE
jgi:hypothetical protein